MAQPLIAECPRVIEAASSLSWIVTTLRQNGYSSVFAKEADCLLEAVVASSGSNKVQQAMPSQSSGLRRSGTAAPELVQQPGRSGAQVHSSFQHIFGDT